MSIAFCTSCAYSVLARYCAHGLLAVVWRSSGSGYINIAFQVLSGSRASAGLVAGRYSPLPVLSQNPIKRNILNLSCTLYRFCISLFLPPYPRHGGGFADNGKRKEASPIGSASIIACNVVFSSVFLLFARALSCSESVVNVGRVWGKVLACFLPVSRVSYRGYTEVSR